jgi:predicted ester cyclase
MRNRILPLAVCTLLVTCLACGESEGDEAMEHDGMVAETMGGNEMVEANMALQRQAFDAVAAGNLDALDGLTGPGYTYHGPSGPAVDLAGSKAQVAGYVTAFPDLHFTFEFQTANDEYSIARVTATGTNTGELMGMAGTGKPISITILNVVRIVDGKVVEEWENFDELGMMRQLGLIPAS